MCLFVAYDTETTGFNRTNDKIISIGWVIFDGNFNILGEGEVIINPDKYIHPRASEVNGFTKDRYGRLLLNNQLIDTITIDEALFIFKDSIEYFYQDQEYFYQDQGDGIYYLAHNGHSFDHKFLEAELTRCNLSLPPGMWTDTLPISRRLYPNKGRRGYSLRALKADLLQDFRRQTHTAMEDAVTLFRVFRQMAFDDENNFPRDFEYRPFDILTLDPKHQGGFVKEEMPRIYFN